MSLRAAGVFRGRTRSWRRTSGVQAKAARTGDRIQPLQAAHLDCADADGAVVCQLANGSVLRMSPTAFWLLDQSQRGRSAGQISAEIADRFDQELGVEEVEAACADVLERVRTESARVARAMRRRYILRVRLLPESVVLRLTARLKWLLSTPVAVTWAIVVCTSLSLFLTYGQTGAGRLNLGTSLVCAYVIYLLALLAHEFGHATACARYGIAPGDIGFAVYLVFPAIYCDVTRAWLLPRRQRFVVDIAGVAFELGAGACYLITSLLFHLPVLMLAAVMVLSNLILILLPMGRFDSYWAISDALGVADLSRQSWNMLRGVFTRKRDNVRRSVMPVYSLYRRVIILGYSLVMILLIGWFSLMLVRVIGPLSSSLRSGSEAIGRDIEAGRVAATMHGLVAEGPGLLMFGVTIYRLAKMVWGPAAKAVSFVHRGLRFGR